MTQAEMVEIRTDKKLPDYPFIRAWERMMRSMPYYLTHQLERAKATNAPQDACYEITGAEGKTGTWKTFSEISSEVTKELIARYVLEMAR